MKRILLYIFVVVLMALGQESFAQLNQLGVKELQANEPTSLLAPNVATLGTFYEPDVALFTGTPSLSIPLFEVPLSDYVLPIELQYNGTSILVDQPPSWVGLGWNLSAGGVITRKVNDEPDEHRFSDDCYIHVDNGDPKLRIYYDDGFFYNYSIWDTVSWGEFKPKRIVYDSYAYHNFPYYYDTEPDDFTFSFPGYHGHFYLNHFGKWEIQCSKAVSVQLITSLLYPPFDIRSDWQGTIPLTKQPSCFAGFIITIEDGTQFVFGNDTSAIDFYTDLFTENQVMHANAWHLTRIISPEKKELLFRYQRQCFTNQMSYNQLSCTSEVLDTIDNLPYDLFYYNYNYSPWNCVSGKLISPVYLKEISTPLLSVRFYNSISQDLQYRNYVYYSRLSSFTQYDDLMPYVTNFTHYNGHAFPQNFVDSIRKNLKRYKLDSIVFSAADSCRKVAFNFNEDTTSRLSLREVVFADKSAYHLYYNHLSDLPDYLSFMTDHWGYYNNSPSQYNTDPMASNYYSTREPNSTYVKYGLLTKLYHPSGSVTEFEYEPNDYSQQVAESRWDELVPCSTIKYGGGVRIKKISYYENTTNEQPTLTKEYFYKTNYISNPNSPHSSGILGERPHYNCSIMERSYEGGTIYRTYSSSNSVLPNCGFESPVCYSEVTEKISSGGYIVYNFSNYSDYLDERPIGVKQQEQMPYGKYTSRKVDRGLLLMKREYNIQKQLIHKTTNSYTPNKPIDKYVKAINWEHYCVSNTPAIASCYFEEGATYKIYTHTMVPETIRDVWYSANGDSIVKSIKNHYDLQSQMPTQIDEMSMTDTITQTFRYPFTVRSMVNHLDGPYMNDRDELCANMIKGHYFLPLEITSYKGNKAVNSIYYHYGKHNTQNSFYAVYSISVLGITEPISFTPVTLTQKDNHYVVPAKQSCQYDAYGNIKEIVTDGVPISYVWGFNHSYVVAKIVGISYSQVQSIINSNSYHLILMSTSCPTLTSLASFRATVNATYPQAQCYTYLYNPLYGIISETDPKGQTLFYDYDVMGRLKEVYYKENDTKRVVKECKYHLKEFE